MFFGIKEIISKTLYNYIKWANIVSMEFLYKKKDNVTFLQKLDFHFTRENNFFVKNNISWEYF